MFGWASAPPQFDADIRAIFDRRGLDRINFEVVGLVIWGRPIE